MRRRAFVDLVMPPATRGHEDVDALAARLAPLFGHDLADQPAIVMTQLRAMGRFDALARLKALADMPTLVVSARYDVISRPALGPILAAAIPGRPLRRDRRRRTRRHDSARARWSTPRSRRTLGARAHSGQLPASGFQLVQARAPLPASRLATLASSGAGARFIGTGTGVSLLVSNCTGAGAQRCRLRRIWTCGPNEAAHQGREAGSGKLEAEVPTLQERRLLEALHVGGGGARDVDLAG